MTPKITTAAEIQKWASKSPCVVKCFGEGVWVVDIYCGGLSIKAVEGRTAQAAIRKAEREIKRRRR